ncbi:MAG: isoamylase early set domain-containing protein [Bacteroidia bacterium]|nr:isoamylase early set domain-containing protein [Bacteroidia bacterium]
MSITKKFLKSKTICKVTFRLPKEVVSEADSVSVVGEFNEWNPSAAPMKPMKSGEFSTTLELEQGNEYQFRYLINGKDWTNDNEADKYVATPYGDAQNSVIVL